jgi:1,4-dihydroxy-2-naphthoate polyprenyltransferase
MKAWVNAMRLRTLPLSISGILTGVACAQIVGKFNATITTLAIFTTLLFQLLSNFANDLGDSLKGADNANRIGPLRAVQSGEITKKQMMFAVFLTSVLSFISAGFLIYFGTRNLPIETIYCYILLSIFCVIAAITYTLGKKAYGYHGLGDLMVILFFGFVAVLGVYPLITKSFSFLEILPAISIGFWSAAVLNLNNMRDRENDSMVGKRTFVVKIGSKNAKMYHFILILTGIISWMIFLFITNCWFGLISCIPFILFTRHLMFVSKTTIERMFDTQLKIVALTTFFTSLLFFISSFWF